MKKISIFPSFSLEAAVATFFNKKNFEIIPIEFTRRDITDNYAQELLGEWCFPLKLAFAMQEAVIAEKKVDKIIGVDFNVCRYPLVMGNIQKWIKRKFEYYPIMMDKLSPTISFYISFLKQIKRANPELNLFNLIKKIPLAKKRSKIAGEMRKFYFKNLPLVKNPVLLKKEYKKAKQEFINADNLKETLKIIEEFKLKTKKERIRKKPKYKFLLSGDFFIIILEFPIIELDVFLAKHGIEIINTGFPSTYYHFLLSKNGKKTKKIISKVLSSKDNKVKVSNKHLIEIITLYQILEGLKKDVDGIIYIKPSMCAPCENLSYVLKQEKNFNLPIVEISYDEHSGKNGVITRLEAFMNIVSDKK